MRRRFRATFAALAALVVVIVAAVVVSTLFFVRAADSVINRWQPAVSSSQRLVTDFVDQNVGLSAYVLGADKSFLTPYRAAHNRQSAETNHLRKLLGADGQLQGRLDDLLSAGLTWQRMVATPAIAATGRGDTTAAAAIVNSPAAVSQFNRIRTAATALQQEVSDRTDSARTERQAAGYIYIAALGLALVLVVAASVGLWLGLHRWVLGPVERLGHQSRLIASGEIGRSIVADGPSELTELGRDVEAMRLQIASELGRAEAVMAQLREQSLELARSNDDLQQFAYVASHDLSEPLRKVANFCQLLERQYSPQLDDRARQYIDFAVDGAKRMQVLITDLLALSRVGRTTEDFAPVDLDEALDRALRTLEDKISSAGARIERRSALPTVSGDRALLTSLLENLVGNAVKYRRDEVAPVIEISVDPSPEGAWWVFTVSDNGIGIEQEYAERIFAVFQRLHLRDQYGGTGIGLALCRRIVEFHNGAIWLAEHVESDPGATFRFTLPVAGTAEDDHVRSEHLHPGGGS